MQVNVPCREVCEIKAWFPHVWSFPQFRFRSSGNRGGLHVNVYEWKRKKKKAVTKKTKKKQAPQGYKRDMKESNPWNTRRRRRRQYKKKKKLMRMKCFQNQNDIKSQFQNMSAIKITSGSQCIIILTFIIPCSLCSPSVE